MFNALLFSIATSAAPLVVSEIDNGSVKVEVDVTVDDEPIRFQLDMGAGTTTVVLDEFTARYPSLGKARVNGVTNAPIECDWISFGKASIDGISVDSLRVKRCALADEKLHNLGLDLLAGQAFELDFQRKEIQFLNEVKSELRQLARLPKGHLKIPIIIDNKMVQTLFDTGAQKSVIDMAFVQANSSLFEFVRDEPGIDSAGRQIPSQIYRLKEMRMGDVVLNDVLFASFDFGGLRQHLGSDVPIILGMNAIVHGRWLFDLKQNRWSCKRPAP